MIQIFRRSLAAVLILFMALGVIAQSKKEQKGDWLMKKFSYKAAATAFEQALEGDQSNPALKKKLADCYRMLNDPPQVVIYYGAIIENDTVVANEDKYYYAQALTSTGKYQEAIKWFAAYAELAPDDQRAGNFYSTLSNLELLYKDSAQFDLQKVYFNSPTMDFSRLSVNQTARNPCKAIPG